MFSRHYIEDARHIHKGGVSYGPYLKIDEGEICRVVIEGSNLTHANLQVYSIQEGKRIDLQPEYKQNEDNRIEFTITVPIDLTALEVAIRNSADNNQEDVVLTAETLEIESVD